ncbi:MAG: hypothetical protein JXB88_18260 [Spirochaetales bacterium]|nr:hypothetical protein [Spirochaetales bacterium]
MKYKSKNEFKKDVPFSGYRFFVFFGIFILTIAAILISVYFYIKYKEFFFLVLAILISLAGFSHAASRISVKAVKYVFKKENSK